MNEEDEEPDEADGSVGLGLVKLGLGLALIACFLPWWGYSSPGHVIGFAGTSAATAFSAWGIGYFIVWLTGSIYLLLRYVFPDAAIDFDPPVADWFLFFSCGGLLAIFALTVPDGLLFSSWIAGGGTDVQFGWWFAIIAGILVTVGGWTMRPAIVPD